MTPMSYSDRTSSATDVMASLIVQQNRRVLRQQQWDPRHNRHRTMSSSTSTEQLLPTQGSLPSTPTRSTPPVLPSPKVLGSRRMKAQPPLPSEGLLKGRAASFAGPPHSKSRMVVSNDQPESSSMASSRLRQSSSLPYLNHDPFPREGKQPPPAYRFTRVM